MASLRRRKNGLPAPPRWRHPAIGSASPALRAAADLAMQTGKANGWSNSTVLYTLDGLAVLLDSRAGGEQVTLTEIRARTPHLVSVPRVAEILAMLGILEDDSVPAIRAWIDRRTGELPDGFAAATRDWLLVLLDGSARSRPRSHRTIYVYFNEVRPLIDGWSARRGHIREVTPEDIRSGLRHLSGWPLCTAGMAVRSLFGFAKRQGLIFANPARGLAASRPAASLLPIDDGEIRAVERAVSGPAQRLMIAPAAIHAARWDAVRVLTLDDIDLPGRRITIAGHSQRLGDLSHQALRAWLDHRRATWPHTPNKHVLISQRTALGTDPVSGGFLTWYLGRHGVSLERIRRDRVLHEALTARADPLQLALVFGISPDGRQRVLAHRPQHPRRPS